MVLVTPLFLTFGSISIGIWLALRFSVYIPTSKDEQFFRALIGKISYPVVLSAVLYFVIGVVGLLFQTPAGEITYEIFFLILFVYAFFFLYIGLKRINIVWPARKLSTFNELLDALNVEDYRKNMASKIYEAYKETESESDIKMIARYMANLLLR